MDKPAFKYRGRDNTQVFGSSSPPEAKAVILSLTDRGKPYLQSQATQFSGSYTELRDD